MEEQEEQRYRYYLQLTCFSIFLLFVEEFAFALLFSLNTSEHAPQAPAIVMTGTRGAL
jgi:hypothetical protein